VKRGKGEKVETRKWGSGNREVGKGEEKALSTAQK
jgi:hypothetical protein